MMEECNCGNYDGAYHLIKHCDFRKENNMDETIQITETSIQRDGKNLYDCQVVKVVKNYEDKRFYVYPKSSDTFCGIMMYTHINSDAFNVAFLKEDWAFFDEQFDKRYRQFLWRREDENKST